MKHLLTGITTAAVVALTGCASNHNSDSQSTDQASAHGARPAHCTVLKTANRECRTWILVTSTKLTAQLNRGEVSPEALAKSDDVPCEVLQYTDETYGCEPWEE